MNRFLSSSSVVALLLAVAVGGWMLSGANRSGPAPTDIAAVRNDARGGVDTAALSSEPPPPAARERGTLRVSVIKSGATSVNREIVVSARTEPNRTIEVRAEVEGRVVALDAERGSVVEEGVELARLDLRDRNARLAEAQALIAQYKLQYEAAERLQGQNLMPEAQVAEARARLVAAQATLADIELEIARTRILAPFDSIVQDREIEIGDFVRIGDTIAELVDIDPIIVVGEVSEREISNLEVGAVGYTQLVDGHRAEGIVRYIAPVADGGTRTFRVELAVPNADATVRAGMTAELRVSSDSLSGHLLSPALLTLDDDGNVGVKTVDAFNRVQFQAVEIVRSTEQGIWVTGLPDEALIIAVGQGFVSSGQLVEPVPLDTRALWSPLATQ